MITQPKSVFIIGTAYSGSSVLGLALNNKETGVAYVGELSRVPGFRSRYNLDLADGQCSACQITQNECPIFSKKLLTQLSKKDPQEAHRYLARLHKAKTIVDSSKHTAWLRLFLQDTNYNNVRVLISVKNPKTYVQSCLDRDIGEPWQAANAWRDTYYDAIRTLNRSGVGYYLVRNEDFVANKSGTILNIQNFLNLPVRKTKSLKPIHAIGGNPAARSEELGAKQVKATARRLARFAFDLNPAKRTPTTKQKITFDTQVIFDTPGLSDVANILGYEIKDMC